MILVVLSRLGLQCELLRMLSISQDKDSSASSATPVFIAPYGAYLVLLGCSCYSDLDSALWFPAANAVFVKGERRVSNLHECERGLDASCGENYIHTKQ